MSGAANNRRELLDLLGALREGCLDADGLRRLEQIVLTDKAAGRLYLEYVNLCASLHWSRQSPTSTIGTAVNCTTETAKPIEAAVSTGTHAPFVPVPAPFFSFSDFAIDHPYILSYIFATVFFSVAAICGHFYKIEHYTQYARTFGTPDVASPRPLTHAPCPSPIARITGMVDVEWGSGVRGRGSGVENPESRAPSPQSLVLGDRLEIASGLVQLTYNSGAKVILQGPCTYEVNSPAGGFLSLGKLTARVDSGQQTVDSAKPQASDIHHSSFRTHHSSPPSPLPPRPSPLFTVKTPTATITDLGTEFGVEVDNDGNSLAHVFCGLVQVAATISGETQQGNAIQLHEKETIQIEKRQVDGKADVVTQRVIIDSRKFARRMASPVKLIDLLDIVAGGNGAGNARERGIDPSTGMEAPLFIPENCHSDHLYHQATNYKLIDGVFVPSGARGPVQIDSAGHVFAGFPKTDGRSWGSIWARALEVPARNKTEDVSYWVYARKFDKQRFMPKGRGLLCLTSNTGITFDLAAIAKEHGELHLGRFRATAGQDGGYLADLWVFVDGKLKWSVEKVSRSSDVCQVDVPLEPNAHFLTLVTTDGGDGNGHDWVVFGDPVLEIISSE